MDPRQQRAGRRSVGAAPIRSGIAGWPSSLRGRLDRACIRLGLFPPMPAKPCGDALEAWSAGILRIRTQVCRNILAGMGHDEDLGLSHIIGICVLRRLEALARQR